MNSDVPPKFPDDMNPILFDFVTNFATPKINHCTHDLIKKITVQMLKAEVKFRCSLHPI